MKKTLIVLSVAGVLALTGVAFANGFGGYGNGTAPVMAPGGMNPGMTVNGMAPGAMTGGMNPGMMGGGMASGTTCGGMNPGMMSGGMAPGMMGGGMTPGMMSGGMNPGMMGGGMAPGMMGGGMNPGMMSGGMNSGVMGGGMNPGMMSGGMAPGMMAGGMPGMTAAGMAQSAPCPMLTVPVPQAVRDKMTEAAKINIDIQAELFKTPIDRVMIMDLRAKRRQLLGEVSDWCFAQKLNAFEASTTAASAVAPTVTSNDSGSK